IGVKLKWPPVTGVGHRPNKRCRRLGTFVPEVEEVCPFRSSRDRVSESGFVPPETMNDDRFRDGSRGVCCSYHALSSAHSKVT
ncbi:MAG: hypothetical protein VXZ49_00985, partial [Planctomycetota bacterium]|nr:hypothetical protein [Planctomycetota bacterium]